MGGRGGFTIFKVCFKVCFLSVDSFVDLDGLLLCAGWFTACLLLLFALSLTFLSFDFHFFHVSSSPCDTRFFCRQLLGINCIHKFAFWN